MSLIVKPGEEPPPPSVSTAAKQREQIFARREAVRALIQQNTEQQLWDSIQAKDLDPQIIQYVAACLDRGDDRRAIRHELGLHNDRHWKKILTAIRAGIRIDSVAMFSRWLTQNESIANRMQSLIEAELELMEKIASGDVTYSSGEKMLYKGFSKELTMAVDAINRLRQGTVKLGKELGVFEQPGEQGKGGQGTTIIIQNNIPFPDEKAIQANQEQLEQKRRELLEKAKAIPTSGHAVHEPKA